MFIQKIRFWPANCIIIWKLSISQGQVSGYIDGKELITLLDDMASKKILLLI